MTHVVAGDDLIGVFATYEGTHLGPLGAFPPTGKRAKFDFAGVFRVENDKLAEFWITWDNMTILGQLGLLPAS
jgi:predicted ester cyclase